MASEAVTGKRASPEAVAPESHALYILMTKQPYNTAHGNFMYLGAAKMVVELLRDMVRGVFAAKDFSVAYDGLQIDKVESCKMSELANEPDIAELVKARKEKNMSPEDGHTLKKAKLSGGVPHATSEKEQQFRKDVESALENFIGTVPPGVHHRVYYTNTSMRAMCIQIIVGLYETHMGAVEKHNADSVKK